MIILFQDLISTSASKRTPKDYEWYKFKGKRSVKLLDGHKDFDMEITSKECFGIRQRGKAFYLVDKDTPDIEFKLSVELGQSLLKRSEGWSGKVGKYKVAAGSFGAKDKPTNSLRDKKPPKPPKVIQSVNTNRSPNADEPKLRAIFKSTKIKNIDRASLLFSEEILPGEWYYYYDLSKCIDEYKDSKGKLDSRWHSKIQRIFDKKTRLETHVSLTNYKGASIPLLVVSDMD